MSPLNPQDEIVAEIVIAAQPERVFQALTNPAEVPKWWGQKGIYVCTKHESDLRIGGQWHTSGVGGDGGHFSAKGEFLEIDPPRTLAYTWVASWTGEVQTQVRWELSPVATGTKVTLRHSGLAAHPELSKAYSGWPRMLQWLEAYLAKGETVESRSAA